MALDPNTWTQKTTEAVNAALERLAATVGLSSPQPAPSPT